MRRFLVVVTLAWLPCTEIVLAQDGAAPTDIVVLNGKIYTVNPKHPWAQALAVKDGKVVAVGTEASVATYRGAKTRVIDARGHLVLPGFGDSHVHFLSGGMSLDKIDLMGTTTVAEMQQRVKDYASSHPNSSWILGRGWSYTPFGRNALPHKKYLDEVVATRPVYLEGSDGHTSWANSKALELAHITADTRDPPNGTIVRDPQTGEPIGALKEEASGLIDRVLPKPSRQEESEALKHSLGEASRVGLTRVHSCGGDFEILNLLDKLRKQNELTLRLLIAYSVNPPTLNTQTLELIEKARRRYQDDWLSCCAAKFMLDGVVESHTAAMIEPYADDTSQKGQLFWAPPNYQQAVERLDERGIQIFTHAIGDRAVRLALDVYEETSNRNGTEDQRPRVEHIETITAADISRFARLGVIASFQPLHSEPEATWMDIWVRNAGPDRVSRAWPWKSISGSQGRLAFGSDWPVVTLNPWEGLQVAVTRADLQGRAVYGWNRDERLTLEQAIEACTLGVAFAGKRESLEGSLEPGKLADLIILSQDLFTIDPLKIGQTEVLLTMVGGREVYRSNRWESGNK